MKIAIDGPGGAGKSTVAKLLAKRLGMTYIDTGAMYRAVALAVARRGIGAGDAEAVIAELDSIHIDISHESDTGEQIVRLGGEDVSAQIRTQAISIGASDVSKIREVRLRLVELQREIARGRDVIMDGRDIGTVVFPDADKKYFLTASPGVRARRRYLELRSKGDFAAYETCLSDLLARDSNDSGRAFAPLVAADDAVFVWTDRMTAREAVDAMYMDITDKGSEPIRSNGAAL
ncbi:MAG: (d)CMP kinase [Oscillospiraceae bacterium]|nr:(d)CMP kinase [Oscillospiraceae bacterium]